MTLYKKTIIYDLFNSYSIFFCKDGNGFITKEELENIMGGVPMDEDTWKAILLESDYNQDGQVIIIFFIQINK